MYVCLCKVHLYDSTSTVRPGKKGRTVEMAFPLRLSQVKGKRRGGRVRTHSRDLISCTKFFEVEGTWGPQPGVRSPRGIYCNIFDALKNNRKKRIDYWKTRERVRFVSFVRAGNGHQYFASRTIVKRRLLVVEKNPTTTGRWPGVDSMTWPRNNIIVSSQIRSARTL